MEERKACALAASSSRRVNALEGTVWLARLARAGSSWRREVIGARARAVEGRTRSSAAARGEARAPVSRLAG